MTPSASPDEVSLALEHVASLTHGPPLDATLRVTLHFHPDRLFRGQPLLEQLAADPVYRSQFETGTSNGGLTAHAEGDRWRWEHSMFGAYDHAAADVRPKYGSLNHRRRPAGGSIRFGSADELARHPDYRGPGVVDAGRAIAAHGWLDARIIGGAARSEDLDDQTLKHLWHCTARYGRPASTER